MTTGEIFWRRCQPLYDAYIVDTNTPSDVKPWLKRPKKIEGVSEVQDGGANTERLFQLASFIRVWGLVIAGLLIFIAVFLISNTIRITIISAKREIQIMRFSGAKNSYIRGPFLLEGAFIGLLGATAPCFGLYCLSNGLPIVNKSLVGQIFLWFARGIYSSGWLPIICDWVYQFTGIRNFHAPILEDLGKLATFWGD